MNGAMIAHDNMKDDLVLFTLKHKKLLQKFNLYATGTTGKRLIDETGLDIHRLQSGPIGGDQQIGALIAEGKIMFVIFFRDPLTAQPHEPDVQALLRLCDVHKIPIATNITSAEIIVHYLERLITGSKVTEHVELSE
ncbi:methylglyoxal synthase [Proteiniclasticum sp.]|uniref:methylglyoxal synthase n=1 Tax=Proteiniclasticum sp. TaxID=2053595 RepID=UPI00289E6279|nr:methylglyoxal synthase [Proteiniclasticum sp.]